MHLFEECLDGIVFSVIVSLVMLFSLLFFSLFFFFFFFFKETLTKQKTQYDILSTELEAEVVCVILFWGSVSGYSVPL